MEIRRGSNLISHYLQSFSSQVQKFLQPPEIIYLLGVIWSALHHYFCLSMLADLSTQFACWITGAAPIPSWYLQRLPVCDISSHKLITVSQILSHFDVV